MTAWLGLLSQFLINLGMVFYMYRLDKIDERLTVVEKREAAK